MANLLASRFGRALVGVRDNPVAATASGVSLVRIKMLAFVVSAAMAGLAGALFAVQKTVVTPDDFTADFSIFFLLMVVLGGAGRLWGPVVGAVVFFLVPELLAALQSWRMLIYGTALLFLMLYAPHGLVGAIEAGWQRLRKRLGLSDCRPAAARCGEPPIRRAGRRRCALGAGRREAFRRRDGAGRRQPRGRRRHHPRDRRAQRLGQDDPAQHDLRLLSDRRRHRSWSTAGRSSASRRTASRAAASAAPSRRRACCRQLSVLDNALLGAYPAERQSAAVGGAAPAARAPRAGRVARRCAALSRLRRPRRSRARAGRRAAARPAAAGRDRPRPGRPPAPAAARRAGGRPVARRARPARRADRRDRPARHDGGDRRAPSRAGRQYLLAA